MTTIRSGSELADGLDPDGWGDAAEAGADAPTHNAMARIVVITPADLRAMWNLPTPLGRRQPDGMTAAAE